VLPSSCPLAASHRKLLIRVEPARCARRGITSLNVCRDPLAPESASGCPPRDGERAVSSGRTTDLRFTKAKRDKPGVAGNTRNSSSESSRRPGDSTSCLAFCVLAGVGWSWCRCRQGGHTHGHDLGTPPGYQALANCQQSGSPHGPRLRIKRNRRKRWTRSVLTRSPMNCRLGKPPMLTGPAGEPIIWPHRCTQKKHRASGQRGRYEYPLEPSFTADCNRACFRSDSDWSSSGDVRFRVGERQQ
jgi:hypothetical protein